MANEQFDLLALLGGNTGNPIGPLAGVPANPFANILTGASPPTVDPLQERISAPAPLVDPTEPEPVHPLRQLGMILANAGSVYAGHRSNLTALEALRQRRTESARRDTAVRQGQSDRRHAAGVRGAQYQQARKDREADIERGEENRDEDYRLAREAERRLVRREVRNRALRKADDIELLEARTEAEKELIAARSASNSKGNPRMAEEVAVTHRELLRSLPVIAQGVKSGDDKRSLEEAKREFMTTAMIELRIEADPDVRDALLNDVEIMWESVVGAAFENKPKRTTTSSLSDAATGLSNSQEPGTGGGISDTLVGGAEALVNMLTPGGGPGLAAQRPPDARAEPFDPDRWKELLLSQSMRAR